MVRFRLACHLVQFGEEPRKDLEKVLRQVAVAGWEGVEGYGVKSADELVEVATLAARHGLHWVNMGGPDGLRTAQYNVTLGNGAAEAVWTRRRDFGGDDPGEEGYRRAAASMREVLAFCRAHNLKCFHHAHLWTMIETVEDAERLLAAAPDLYLLLDTGHLLAARSDPLQVFRSERLRGRTAHVHLKDFHADDPARWDHRTSRWGEEGRFAELGAGNMGLDAKAVLQALEAIGYDSWVSVELDAPYPPKPPAEAARANRDYLRRLGY